MSLHAMGWTLLDLAGSVALLLWGVHMVQSGVERAFGPELRRFLRARLANRFAALFSGLALTAVLQSSTATGLMVTGLSAAGAIGLESGVAVMLGANIGTTLIVQVLSFDVAAISPGLVVLGVVAFRRANQPRTRDLGRVSIGLGLMLLALQQLVAASAGIIDNPILDEILRRLDHTPVLAALLSAALTWGAHSSVAIVLLTGSLAAKGVVPLGLALALVAGANLGTAINPLVEGAGANPTARRVPLGNLLTRCVGCAVALPLLDYFVDVFHHLGTPPVRAVADFHTWFNVVLAVFFLPLIGPFSALLRRLQPARDDADDPGRPHYLDPQALDSAPLAIAAAAREALRMADWLESMLKEAAASVRSADRRHISQVRRQDDILDRLDRAIGDYLGNLRHESLSPQDERRAAEILTFITNLESAGDALDRTVLAPLTRRLKRSLPFIETERAETARILERLAGTTRAAAAVFLTEDARSARALVEEKEAFRALEAATTARQLGQARPTAPAIQIDLLYGLKQINSHLVAAAAYPVLEEQGELLRSRLRA